MSNRKIWLIADTHFGLKGDDQEWLDDYAGYFEDVLIPMMKKEVGEDDILVHCGDVFDNRTIIGLNTITRVISIFEKLSSIFNDIDAAIRSEQLYKNVNLQRQDICNHFGISRHTLNNLLAENAGGLSFPQYVNNIRLEVALRLLREDPAKTISAIATEVGFSPANLREQFKRKYGMTPAEYRQNQ